MIFTEKNVVIVGSCGGIGLATCRQLLQNNVANLAMVDCVNCAVLDDLEKEYPNTSISFFKMDITKKTEIESVYNQIVEKLKFVDILVNCAGIATDDNPELAIGVNLLGLINSTLTMFKFMDKSQGGRGGLIVNVASVLGLDPYPTVPIYSATKHGVVGFTRSLGVDFYFKKTGIAFITICPGVTDTNILRNITYHFSYYLEYSKLRNHPLQSADDCARNIVEAIKINKNGTVWMCDDGKLKEVNIKKYWDC